MLQITMLLFVSQGDLYAVSSRFYYSQELKLGREKREQIDFWLLVEYNAIRQILNLTEIMYYESNVNQFTRRFKQGERNTSTLDINSA